MDLLFSQTVPVQEQDCNEFGDMKLSALLYDAQEISGCHCAQMGFGWDSMAEKDLFWAVLRHRIIINRLPRAGQNITLETWPMPATRVAYPRSVRGLDEQGNILFHVVSIWVLMHTKTRAMVLPGKSGVQVPGMLRGMEPEGPSTLVPGTHENTLLWQVQSEDLDRNGHVNNARYLDHAESLAGDFRQSHSPKEATVCYLAEVLPEQEITLDWTLSPEGSLTVDGYRTKTDVCQGKERVFAVKLTY